MRTAGPTTSGCRTSSQASRARAVASVVPKFGRSFLARGWGPASRRIFGAKIFLAVISTGPFDADNTGGAFQLLNLLPVLQFHSLIFGTCYVGCTNLTAQSAGDLLGSHRSRA